MAKSGPRIPEGVAGLKPAAIGLRAKTGRAIAIVLAGSFEAPIAIKRHELVFATLEQPELFQPWHEALELAAPNAKKSIDASEVRLGVIATDTLKSFVRELESEGFSVQVAGIVGAPERDITKLGSPHIRAHAGEGLLFRRILEQAVQNLGIKFHTFNERQIGKEPGSGSPSEKETANKLAEFGKVIGRPWRLDEKAAALGAWLSLRP